METRKISTLKINTLVSQEQYDKAYDENKIEQDSIYLVPDDTEEIAENKANEALESAKEYTDLAIQNKANTDDLASHTEDTNIHVTEEDKSKWNTKADSEHNHDDVYYTETEVDAKFTTVNQSIGTLNSEVETVKGDLTSHATTSNTQFETIRSEFAQADTSTLTTAKEYSDANKSAAVTEAKAYTDSEIEKLVTDTEFEGVLTTIQEIQGAMATDAELAQALEEANGKKVDKVEKGSSTKPIYLDSTGTPQEIAYKIEQDLPADAKLTDTTYTLIKDATQKKIQLMSGETLISEVDDNNTTYEVATTDNIGLLSAEDKTKLDGIETGANAYTHPTTAGNKHIPSGGSEGQVLIWSEDGTAIWGEASGGVGISGSGAKAEIFNNYTNNIASGSYSHAEGGNTTASGNYSHAEGTYTIASGNFSHTEGSNTTASGKYTHAEGASTTASGESAHAEGYSTNKASNVTTSTDNAEIQTAWETTKFSLAKGNYSHVEGMDNLALGNLSHVEGYRTIASGRYSHSEGYGTKASSDYQHTQGKYNIEDTEGKYAHIVGNGKTASSRSNAHTLDWNGNAWFKGKVYIGGTSRDDATELSSVGKNVANKKYTINDTVVTASPGSEIFNDYEENVATGMYSHSQNYKTTASGYGSHAEGMGTTASGKASHSECSYTTASGECSHAEGGSHMKASTITQSTDNDEITAAWSSASKKFSLAKGKSAHVEGYNCLALENYSHAEGYQTIASGESSSTHGYYTTASTGYAQAVFGKYNTKKTAPSTADTQDSTNADALFIVGCGTSSSKNNAFRVTSGGKCYGTTSFGSSGADFAELFEWADGNPDNEDRRGLFVTLEGEKIRIANADDDYIGVISDNQAFIGNSASEEWQGKYLTDIFGGKLTQEVEVPEVVNEETGEVIQEATTAIQYVLNPDYDPDEEYIMRENRKEWGIVGLVGQIVMIDDGSCVVGGRVIPKENGIGTASTTKEGYRVMARLDESHIKVLVK